MDTPTTASPSPSQPAAGSLYVVVHSAMDLPCDRTTKPDAFVEVHTEGASLTPAELDIEQNHTKWGSAMSAKKPNRFTWYQTQQNNPVWDEQFSIQLQDVSLEKPRGKLVFLVYEHNTLRANKLIGQAEIEIAVAVKKTGLCQLPLTPPQAGKDSTVAGSLVVVFNVNNPLPDLRERTHPASPLDEVTVHQPGTVHYRRFTEEAPATGLLDKATLWINAVVPHIRVINIVNQHQRWGASVTVWYEVLSAPSSLAIASVPPAPSGEHD